MCVGSTPHVPATLGLPRTGVSVLSPSTLLRLPAALYGVGPALSAVPVFGSSTKARIPLRLRFVSSPASAVQAARGLGTLSTGAARLFPPRPQRAPLGLRKSSDRNQGLFAGWEGVASLGLSLPLSPAPCLLPPAGMAGSSLEFLSPLVLRTAGGVFRPVNFSLRSNNLKKLLLTALRAFGPVLTPSNAARSSPFCPHLLVAGAGVWGTFLLGVAFST